MLKISIALFRGINVGGNNIIKMNDLKALMENLGAKSVKTYIQSGNAVFLSDQNHQDLAEKIQSKIQETHGFAPELLLLQNDEFNQAIVDNPFPQAKDDPKAVHLFFLKKPPTTPDLEGLKQLQSATEQYALIADRFYLFAPDGIGRSKLATKAEKLLGEPATARNWRTILKIQDLAESLQP